MIKNDNNYTLVIEEIKRRLRDYMELEGIDIRPNGSFKCPNSINHKHGDNNPSGSYRDDKIDGYPGWKCYKCNISGDTFELAGLLYNLPQEGKGFITETIPTLCEKLGIPIPESTEELDQPTKWSIADKRILSNNLITMDDLTGSTYARNYSKDLAYRIIKSFPIAKLNMDIPKENPANPILHHARKGVLLIPIYYDGLITGMIARNPISDTERPKYQNSLKDADRGIYYPSIINLDKGIQKANKAGILYIFEGIFNSIAAIAMDLPVIGTLGTSFKVSEILPKIQKSGNIKEIVLCMDKDSAGKDAAITIARNIQNNGTNVTIFDHSCISKEYINDDYDENFSKMPEKMCELLKIASNRITLIEYTIKYKLDYMQNESLSLISKFNNAVSDIANYGSPLLVSSYANLLSEAFSEIQTDYNDILIGIKEALKDSNSPLLKQIDLLTSRSLNDVVGSNSIELKQDKIRFLYESTMRLIDSGSANIINISKRKMIDLQEDDKNDVDKIFRTNIKNLDEGIDDPTKNSFMLTDSQLVGVAGKPGHGKSLFVRKIAMAIAEIHKEDTFVVYFSIDDNKKRTYQWMISSLARVPIRYVMYLSNPLNAHLVPDNIKDRIINSKKALKNLLGENLFVFDKSEAGTTEEVVSIMKRFSETNHDKWPVFIIDNMFNINNISRAKGDKRGPAETYIDIMKELTTTKKCLIINTLEVIKNLIGRIKVSDLKETGSIDFRNDITLSVFNSYKEYGDLSRMYEGEGEDIAPIIELTALKVKVGSPGSVYYFDLDGPSGYMEGINDPSRIGDLHNRKRSDLGRQERNNFRVSGFSPTVL